MSVRHLQAVVLSWESCWARSRVNGGTLEVSEEGYGSVHGQLLLRDKGTQEGSSVRATWVRERS